MGERSDGQWATPRVGLSVPRQNGKGAIIEARELAGLLVFGEQSIVHSAHEQKTARVGFDRIKAYFDNYDDLRRKVKAIGTAVAREYIELTTGQFLRFPARTKGSIRGFSIDCLILDEAQEFSDSALQAVMPTLAARPNPQMWMIGTPPTPENEGEVFTRWRDAGLKGEDRRLAWSEWSTPPEFSLDDREGWAASNPALGVRISYEAVADERAALDDEGFGRERLGRWATAGGSSPIPMDGWVDRADPLSRPESALTLGVEVAPNLSWASVSLAGRRADGDWHVELIENRVGAAWMPAFVEALLRENPAVSGVVGDVGGPLKALITDRGHNVYRLDGPDVNLTPMRVAELGGACSRLVDGVVTGWLRHIDQPLLTLAARSVGKRQLGDSGLWVFSRRATTSDTTPIQSATYALWGAQNQPQVARPATRAGGRGYVTRPRAERRST